MIKLLAIIHHISNGVSVFDTTWFNDATEAEMYANGIVEKIKLEPGVVDWKVTLTDVEQRDELGAEILHLCMDDVQHYYEHRMAWRDNFDVARQVQARRRALIDNE